MEIASVMSGPIRTEEREQALTALIESHRGRLLSIIRKRIRDQVEAEDVLQDVFAEFVEAYDLGQAIEALGAWLVRVAQNKILDRFRRQTTQSSYETSVRAATDAEQTSSVAPMTNGCMRGCERKLSMLSKCSHRSSVMFL